MKKKRQKRGHHEPGVRFIMLPRNLLVHNDWTHQPPAARVIFLDMCMYHYDGDKNRQTNNGHIGYGCAAGAKAANVSVATASRMLKSLHKGGLINLRKKHIWKEKDIKGSASEWEISIFRTRTRPSTRPAAADGKIRIEHRILTSNAYRKLDNVQRCTLIEMMRRFDGGNNGQIKFGVKDGSWACFGAETTRRALIGLESSGFIVKTAAAVPAQKQRRHWRLTMYEADGKPATKDFMRTAKAAVEGKPDRCITEGEIEENVAVTSVRSVPNSSQKPSSTPVRQGQNEDFRGEMPPDNALVAATIGANLTLVNATHLARSMQDKNTVP